MEEIKKEFPTSFRLETQVAEAFKELAKINGYTQNEALKGLLDVFETQNAKKILVERKKEIESFEDYSQKLVALYLSSLALNHDTEERISNDLKKQLEAKDTTIQNLQEDYKKQRAYLESLENEKSEIKEKNDELSKSNSALVEINNKNITITEKNEEQIKMLNDLLTEHKQFKDENLILATENKDLVEKSRELAHQVKDLTMQITNHLSRVETMAADLEELKAEILEEREINKSLRIEHKEDITKLENQYEQRLENLKTDQSQSYSEKLAVSNQRFENELEKLNIQLGKASDEIAGLKNNGNRERA